MKITQIMFNFEELFNYALSIITSETKKFEIAKYYVDKYGHGIDFCFTCNNKKTIEELSCAMAASECCGGCFETIDCPDCEN